MQNIALYYISNDFITKKIELISFYRKHDEFGLGSKFHANFQCAITLVPHPSGGRGVTLRKPY